MSAPETGVKQPMNPDHKVEITVNASAVVSGTSEVSQIGPGELKYSYGNQFRALLSKSTTLQKRQYRTNCCQILFPLLLMILLLIFQLIVTTIIQDTYGKVRPRDDNPRLNKLYFTLEDLDASDCKSFVPPRVEPKAGVFLISGDPAKVTTSEIGRITNATQLGSGFLGNMTFENGISQVEGVLTFGVRWYPERGGAPPDTCKQRPLIGVPKFSVLPDRNSMEAVLFAGWNRKPLSVAAAYHLNELDVAGQQFDIDVYDNRSMSYSDDIHAVMSLAANAVFRLVVPNFDPEISGMIMTGTKNYPFPEGINDFDIVSLIGPNLYLFIFQLLLPVFMSNLVLEKELKLREVMKMMGLKGHIYYLVTYLFNFSLYLIATLVVMIMAAIFRFRFFTENDPGIIFLLFFIWGHTMVALSFFLAVFFTRSRTATVVGYLYVFGSGILATSLIETFFNDSTTPTASLFFIQLIPTFAFYRGISGLRDGVSFDAPGLKFSDLSDPEVPIATAFGYLVVEWIVLLFLAWYLENVLPSSIGVKKHPLFCIRKEYWNSKKAPVAGEDKVTAEIDPSWPDDLKEQARLANEDKTAAIRVLNLRKVYADANDGQGLVAVKKLSMVVKQNECFGFLGPNGAGKSTTINMLCGYTMPSSGVAYLYGWNIVKDADLVHLVMGVCPQENVLWETLTAAEHLAFYGRLKGLTGDRLEHAIDKNLDQVQLLDVKHKKAGEFSGGMKRRLCVAMALIGDPKIVLLDEPTTGLDPGARRNLWDIIKQYKKRTCMLLTTHSMEEAEALCDHLSIFTSGELRCVGTSAALKQRFERGYKLSITCESTQYDEKIRDFVMKLAPSAELLNAIAGTQNFEVPKKSIQLSTIFREMEQHKASLHITDWGISNTTLEEVFVRIANADAKGLERALSTPKLLKGEEKKNGTTNGASDNGVVAFHAD